MVLNMLQFPINCFLLSHILRFTFGLFCAFIDRGERWIESKTGMKGWGETGQICPQAACAQGVRLKPLAQVVLEEGCLEMDCVFASFLRHKVQVRHYSLKK